MTSICNLGKQTILVLGAGRNQVPMIKTGKRMGLRVAAIDPSPDAPGSTLADRFLSADLADRDSCLDFAKEEQVDGVTTLAAEYPVPTLGFLCQELGLPGIDEACALKSTNKQNMRRAFCRVGIQQPQFYEVADVEDAVAAVRQLDGNAIVKPAVGNGKKGITSVRSAGSSAHVRQAFLRARDSSRNEKVLVEEFVDGDEFSVEALTINGKTSVVAITEKFTTRDPHWVEIGHLQPARISEEEAADLSSLAGDAVSALGIDNSASHTEIRRNSRGAFILEVGARLGGGFITSHLVPLSTGVDLIEAAIRVAIGEIPELRVTRSGGAAIWFLTPQPGHVISVEGAGACREAIGFADLQVYVAPAESVMELTDNSQRAGHVIATGSCAAEALERVQNLVSQLRVATVPTTIQAGAASPASYDAVV